MKRPNGSILLLSLALVFPSMARAQTEQDGMTEEERAFMSGGEGGGQVEETQPDADQAFLTDSEKAEIEAPEQDTDAGLKEDPEKPYFGIGLRLRWLMIPKWFVGLFNADIKVAPEHESALPMISSMGIGPEFTYRKDGFDITAAIWYAGLGWDGPISFKGEGEDGNSWEVIENSLKAILITADFIWSTSIVDWFAITYGAGLGFGIPFGDIKRTEATEASNGLEKCRDPEDVGADDWCNTEEEYGETYALPTGIVPWINLLLGARFKPHRHVAIYVDGGFALGFQMGVRGEYIF